MKMYHFMDGTSVSVNDERHNAIEYGIKNGAKFFSIDGNQYAISTISKITQYKTRSYKTYDELGLPDQGDGLTDKQRARLTAPTKNNRLA